jgi:hypothetical protein
MAGPASLNTPSRLITQALRDCGRLQIGDTPTGEVIADAMGRLTDLINTWQTQGLKLWLNTTQSITLTAGLASYTLGPAGAIITVKPMRVIEGWFVRADSTQYPIWPLSWNEYQRLGNLTAQGAINSYFVDKQAANLVVKFWQVPNATAALGTVKLLIQAQALAPTELDETMSFPIEWFLALRWALADELATGQPLPIMERCQAKSLYYRDLLEDWDVEDAPTRWQIDPITSGMRPSRFR